MALRCRLRKEASILLIPAKGVHLDRALQGEFVYQPNLGGNMCRTGESKHELAGLDSMVIAPLMHESKVLGIITTARKGLNSFSPDELEFLRQLADHVGLALAQTELLHELQEAYQNLQRTQQLVFQRERLRAVAEMAGGIAHDINNAISPVALYTDALLGSEPNLSERGRKQLKTIQLAIDDVARAVDRMGQFSRRQEEGTELSTVNLATVCDQAMELTKVRWHDILQRNGISIEFKMHHDEAVPPIDASEPELREALTNLIFNAVDAMPRGGEITLSTDLEQHSGHDQVVIALKDTGLGMPGMDGRQVAETIKHLDPKCPVALLTGWGKQIDPLTAPIPNVYAVLAKPPRISEIQALLDQLVQNNSKS